MYAFLALCQQRYESHLQIVFLYKLIDGVATSSFGTHVANLAGVPLDVVERADAVSKTFAEQFKERLQVKQKKYALAKLPLPIQADFAFLWKLVSGEAILPSDPSHQKAVLATLRASARRFISVQ
jgi:DNA mismatch repair protein MSH6